MRFSEMTAPEIRGLDRDRLLVVAPIAACEQHSDHLPIFTDSILCGAVADSIERALPDRGLLLPLLWWGASEHHLPLGGTLTATLPTYETVIMELLTPMLRDGFRRFWLLNGHGGNIDPMHVALRRLDVAFPTALLTGAAYWEIAAPVLASLCTGPRKSMGHACEIETSLMLHLRADLVRHEYVRNDPSLDPAGLDGLFWARDFARRTNHGAVGYPEFASADRGKMMFEAIVESSIAMARRLLEAELPG